MLDESQSGLAIIEEEFKAIMKKEIEIEETWGKYFDQIRAYQQWLKEKGHYIPDFLAKKDNQVFHSRSKIKHEWKNCLFSQTSKRRLTKS